MRYLMHRNALLTIIKNYEEGSFRRILPLAFVMAVKRAVRCSGVRKESFYFWSKEREETSASEGWQDALNHLVAVDDVMESLPKTITKRNRIQALRKRSDAEILSLFDDPLRPIVEDPEYIAQEIEYLKLMHLDELFSVNDYQKLTEGVDDALRVKIANLKKELIGLQWQGLRTMSHPIPEQKDKSGTFLELWKALGFRRAVARSLKKIRRGF